MKVRSSLGRSRPKGSKIIRRGKVLLCIGPDPRDKRRQGSK